MALRTYINVNNDSTGTIRCLHRHMAPRGLDINGLTSPERQSNLCCGLWCESLGWQEETLSAKMQPYRKTLDDVHSNQFFY